MKQIIACCAYCERDAGEVVRQSETPVSLSEALVYVQIGQTRVLLCPEDRGERPTLSEQDLWNLLIQPIDLPPGILRLPHHCPMLEYDGFAKDEATFTIEFEQDGDYMIGHCGECGMSVRSLVVLSNHQE